MRGSGWWQPLVVACLAEAVPIVRVHAAEWAIAPTMSLTMDYASNRNLSPQPVWGDGGLVSFDALFKRATETLELDAQPSFSVQRYTRGSAANNDSGAITLSAQYHQERSTFALSGAYSDLSTLNTELTSTGVIQGNTHQQQSTVNGTWQRAQSELWQCVVQVAYADVHYVGQTADLLPGYRLPTASVTERYTVTPATSVSFGVSASQTQSVGPAGDSSDQEATVTIEHSFTDRVAAIVSVGRSERESQGDRNGGFVGEAQLSRQDELNHWKLLYQRSTVATGFGGLVQRDAYSLELTRPIAERLTVDVDVSETRDRNVFFFGFLQQGRRYLTAEGGFDWISSETTTLGLRAGYDQADVDNTFVTIPRARNWRAALNFRWTPRPLSLSR